MRQSNLFVYTIVLFFLILKGVFSENTVGLILNETGAFEGYTLFGPTQSKTVYLIDMDGQRVNSWSGAYEPGNAVYLLENGHLLKTCTIRNNRFTAGGSGGLVREFDWDDNLIWEYKYSGQTVCQHHDIARLPNGNVLILAWEYKTIVQAVAAGRNPLSLSNGKLWSEHVVEVEPVGKNSGKIVWEWHVWDHLIQDYDAFKSNYGVVTDSPELMDLNFVGQVNNSEDWLHANAIAYNAERDEILISLRHISEIWIIDHSTTTEEAAGHTGGRRGKGGDILYRWGNPQVYDHGSASDQMLFKQHDAHWIPAGYPGAGNILIFSNGTGRPGGNMSSVDEIEPPLDESGQYVFDETRFGPEQNSWSYSDGFYSSNISGAGRLPNGNTLICDGVRGTFFEVTQDKEKLWEYINPVTRSGTLNQGESPAGGPRGNHYENQAFRAYRYAPDYVGFEGQDLSPKGSIEQYPASVTEVQSLPEQVVLDQNYPNPFNPQTTISFSLSEKADVSLTIINALGQGIATLADGELSAGEHRFHWVAGHLPGGIYICTLKSEAFMECRKMMLSE